RRPEPRDVSLGLGELRHGRATTYDAVDVSYRRGDVVRRALHLDEEDRLSVGKAELRLPALQCIHRAPIEELRRRRQHAGLEEIVEGGDGVLERRVTGEHDATRGRSRLHAQAKARDDAERALRSDEESREVDP